jgi:hypothetical protein
MKCQLNVIIALGCFCHDNLNLHAIKWKLHAHIDIANTSHRFQMSFKVASLHEWNEEVSPGQGYHAPLFRFCRHVGGFVAPPAVNLDDKPLVVSKGQVVDDD